MSWSWGVRYWHLASLLMSFCVCDTRVLLTILCALPVAYDVGTGWLLVKSFDHKLRWVEWQLNCEVAVWEVTPHCWCHHLDYCHSFHRLHLVTWTQLWSNCRYKPYSYTWQLVLDVSVTELVYRSHYYAQTETWTENINRNNCFRLLIFFFLFHFHLTSLFALSSWN